MREIHRVSCENPVNKMWNMFVYFESEPHVKQLFDQYYQDKYKADTARLSFQNTRKFIYYIKQGREYFHTASRSADLVKPLLLYYGMVSLLKAFILTADAHYPTHTKVLQHGMTCRKLKKLDYTFSDDEVKIQRDGLFPLVAAHLGSEQLVGEKFKMKNLLAMLPELRAAYEKTYEHVDLEPIHISKHVDYTYPYTTFYLPEHILDKCHLSYSSFIHFLNRYNHGQARFTTHDLEAPQGIIRLNWHHPEQIQVLENPTGFDNDLFIQDYKGNHYFYTKPDAAASFIPEILVHYMLMYTLGMICRYETELWGEMIFSLSSTEMFIIQEFLAINERKFPNMILNLLFQERFIFETK
ncbi:hypothetical protein BEP19_11545 [Ammoniphilus oxalaticus]|uniref:YaaC-like Protein n=1 Tax=Ammoniphilus oxalaticus TaxID=66863 RepID=A0A419SGJ8_9BACL|nr:YaaC family protein [Ammoniphilus oxalaticus]RKD22865.1 hypothetical protein BEP19_11545 [Ammoniphilus oxalaticus]